MSARVPASVDGAHTVTVTRRDLVVAGAWWVVAILGFVLFAPPLGTGDAELTVPSPGSAAWWAGLLLLTGQGAMLVLRRTRPRATLLAVTAVVPLAAFCGLGDATGVTSLAVIAAAYTAGRDVALIALRAAGPTAGGLVGAGHLVNRLRLDGSPGAAVGEGLLQGVAIVGVPVAVAVFVAARRDARQAREGQTLAEAAEREARLEATVSHERMAMARELHDIAAHHLSGIAVLTAAIGPQIDTDPAGAKVAVAQVRESSRTLLRDLRSLVGLLRDGAPADREQPSRQQTLAGLTALVDDAARAGAVVDLTVLAGTTGELGAGVGPLAQLAAFRIVQESLTNAARHAAGAMCRVVVDDRGDDVVVVTVVNELPHTTVESSGGSSGFGLVGMRERAELTGAELRYGRTADGTWEVRVSIPRDSDRGPA